MEDFKARLRFLRMSPQKVRLVADSVRGKRIQEALDSLRFARRASAMPVYKLLRSALTDADRKGGVDVDTLYVKRIMVDKGPCLKRWMPRARGRASPIRKMTSHVTVVLGSI